MKETADFSEDSRESWSLRMAGVSARLPPERAVRNCSAKVVLRNEKRLNYAQGGRFSPVCRVSRASIVFVPGWCVEPHWGELAAALVQRACMNVNTCL